MNDESRIEAHNDEEFMKKRQNLLMALMALLMTVSGSVQVKAERIDEDESISEIIWILKKTNVYVFLGRGDERNLKDTFNRSGVIEIGESDEFISPSEFEWTVMSPTIASIEQNGEDLYLTGKNFGQTILKAEPKTGGETRYFSVFVTPTVTVHSPDGVVYSYQKTYGQPVRISLSENKDYLVNCVMIKGLNGNNDWVDVTAEVGAALATNGDDDTETIVSKYYQSNETVENNLLVVISYESREENETGNVVGGSGINVQVRDHDVTFVDSKTGELITDSMVSVTQTVYNSDNDAFEEAPVKDVYLEDGTIRIDENGIFMIRLNKYPEAGHFKIIIHD